jgi:DNA helicase II / ATP-dependent DNA helicase PcrA
LIELTENQKNVLTAGSHLLVVGGPGSGKTTVSILKAAQVAENNLASEQKILFLSFARATVSRVWEALDESEDVNQEIKKRIVVDTYHSFFWSIIKTHGYLLGLPRKLEILTPSAEAIALSSIRNDYGAKSSLTDKQKQEKEERENAGRERLATEEGKVCFDLFSRYCASLLHSSTKIRELISKSYPYVILDEFQDTSSEQWSVVQGIGVNSTLLALADPEQRIFDFIGADPERLDHFREEFSPQEFDLSDANHRSSGTEISIFGNDILRGTFKESYSGIYFATFQGYKNPAYAALKGQVLQARKRLIDSGKDDWSLAVLVPTKRMMRVVSDNFREVQGQMPTIRHQASIDMHGAILAAEMIAFLLQPEAPDDEKSFVELLCGFFQGKGGDNPTKTDLGMSENINKAYAKVIKCREEGKNISATSIMNNILDVYEAANNLPLTGNADDDWISIRKVLEDGDCKRLKLVAEEARNIRLLDRGTQLREALSQTWRDHGSYLDALEIVRQAFIQEHFATSVRPETGVIIMNMHKAKGKQFDEVIIFEGWPQIVRGDIVSNPDRIVRSNSNDQDLTHYRQNFRVSVTRAKQRTTIMTPANDICVLFTADKNN